MGRQGKLKLSCTPEGGREGGRGEKEGEKGKDRERGPWQKKKR